MCWSTSHIVWDLVVRCVATVGWSLAAARIVYMKSRVLVPVCVVTPLRGCDHAAPWSASRGRWGTTFCWWNGHWVRRGDDRLMCEHALRLFGAKRQSDRW